jgi:uncharacterized membrane protein
MNRKQEVALWVFGLALAGISAYEGARDGDWWFASFLPVMLIGALVFSALRTRERSAGSRPSPSARALVAVVAVVLGTALVGYFRARFDDVGRDLDTIREAMNEVSGKADDANDAIDHVADGVAGLADQVTRLADDLESQ